MASRASSNRKLFQNWLARTQEPEEIKIPLEPLPLPKELMEKTKISELSAEDIEKKAELLGKQAINEYLRMTGSDYETYLENFQKEYEDIIENNAFEGQEFDTILLTIENKFKESIEKNQTFMIKMYENWYGILLERKKLNEIYEFEYNSFIDICINELILTALKCIYINKETLNLERIKEGQEETVDRLLNTAASLGSDEAVKISQELSEKAGPSTMENLDGGRRLRRKLPRTSRKKARRTKQ